MMVSLYLLNCQYLSIYLFKVTVYNNVSSTSPLGTNWYDQGVCPGVKVFTVGRVDTFENYDS